MVGRRIEKSARMDASTVADGDADLNVINKTGACEADMQSDAMVCRSRVGKEVFG